ncbi:MAG TPA: DUF5668 domain-containing protein [Thermoanaerobaculia bacterium]
MNPAENTWPHEVPETEPPAPAPLEPAAPPAPQLPKNPSLAAFLSLFPGIGNVYNGLYLRGVTFFLLIISSIRLADRHEVFAAVAAFFWVFSLIDAYRQAVLINYGYAQDLGLLDRPRSPRASQGGMAAGVLLILIGLIATLDQFFHIDFEWLFKLWPVALVVIGLWLVAGSLRDRRRERQP